MIYFTADWHLNHEKIIKYCDRPFSNIKEMNNTIIRNYKEVIDDNDTVYFLGDLCLYREHMKESFIKTFSKLPGRKILIMGNHDYLNPFTYIECGFESVHTSLLFNENIVLVHDPSIAKVDKTKYWLCGHVHKLFKSLNGNIINVGVDVWKFYPVNLQRILLTFNNMS